MQTRVRNSYNGHCCGVPILVFLASVIIALASSALILILACHSQCDTHAESKSVSSPSHHSIMVVRYACIACAGCPTNFTTNKCAALHYASSVACNQSQRGGIATVVKGNSPADVDSAGSGAAGLWAGPLKNAGGRRFRPCPGSAGEELAR